MIIDLYCFCWNEADLLGFLFKNYDPFVRKYVIYDSGSTDGSRDILQAHPRVEMRARPAFDPKMSTTVAGLAVIEAAWRTSSSDADWVIITDVDEHLYHRDFLNYLKFCKETGITIVPALGYEMVSSSFPRTDQQLSKVVTTGTPFLDDNKLNLFDPQAITRLNYGPGRHRAWPKGLVVAPERDEMMLLHYKYLGFERVLRRHEDRRPRLNSADIESGFAHRWQFTRDQLKADWVHFEQDSVDVSREDLNPCFSHSALRWWEPYRPSAAKICSARAPGADEALAEAQGAHEADVAALLDAAMPGLTSGSLDKTVAEAAELRRRFPNDFLGYQLGMEAAQHLGEMHEANALCAEAIARFPTLVWPLAYGLLLSKQLGKPEESASRAAELRRRFPDYDTGYHVGAVVARTLGRLDDAARLSAEGARRFPMHVWPLVEAAHIARSLGKLDEATRLGADLCRRFPKHPAGYHVGAMIARQMNRLEEAATFCAVGRKRFPMYAWPLAESAHLSRSLGKLEQATEETAELRQRFPKHPTGYHLGAITARQLGRLDEAAALSADASAHFPHDAWPLVEQAQVAKAQRKLDQAMERAAELRRRFPGHDTGYQIGAAVARELGRLSEARDLCVEAARRSPANAWPLIERAHIARALGQLDEAAVHAADLRLRFPKHPAGYQIGASLAKQSGRLDDADRLSAEAMQHAAR